MTDAANLQTNPVRVLRTLAPAGDTGSPWTRWCESLLEDQTTMGQALALRTLTGLCREVEAMRTRNNLDEAGLLEALQTDLQTPDGLPTNQLADRVRHGDLNDFERSLDVGFVPLPLGDLGKIEEQVEGVNDILRSVNVENQVRVAGYLLDSLSDLTVLLRNSRRTGCWLLQASFLRAVEDSLVMYGIGLQRRGYLRNAKLLAALAFTLGGLVAPIAIPAAVGATLLWVGDVVDEETFMAQLGMDDSPPAIGHGTDRF